MGLAVCYECYETRHSQDFVMARVDKQKVPFGRRALDPIYVSGFDDGFDGGFG